MSMAAIKSGDRRIGKKETKARGSLIVRLKVITAKKQQTIQMKKNDNFNRPLGIYHASNFVDRRTLFVLASDDEICIVGENRYRSKSD